MIDKIVNKFIEYQFRVGLISKEDICIYKYGYTLMLEMLINLLIAILIGYFLGELPVVLFFLTCFIPLRSYCGGYHAPKAWLCIILSNTIILSITLIFKYFYLSISSIELFLLFLIEIILIAFIVKLSPVESLTKKLNTNEKNSYKRHIKVILIIELILGIILFGIEWKKYCYAIIITHIVQVFALILARNELTFCHSAS
ncbi:accessory gene regulator B [Lachnotalea glycerini]|uniref:Accessory gene regulator B n=1 Tax=Lachnotalea glycerini TaxID=1763509 RepID=A0A255IN20_9FIRM|nr:accessory gene regulator B family protein [Lachnotalea glycerini]PXV95626.1 accessory gene regulator B [Lachnotalea glycerini]RDY32916.1 hypothetical protein CG710_002975 [Lachnotalea glycerini]